MPTPEQLSLKNRPFDLYSMAEFVHHLDEGVEFIATGLDGDFYGGFTRLQLIELLSRVPIPKPCEICGENHGQKREDDFTLILTKGVHLISAETALTIRTAIEEDARTVEVSLDPFSGTDNSRMTMLAVRHVVAITLNPVRDDSKGALSISARKQTTSRRR